MADIFISYERDDAIRAEQLMTAFTGLGWSVWWDDNIRAGAPFDLVIDQQLDLASCVVVVWSTASVASNWVRAEANAADEQGKLLPISFERDLRIPVRFRQLRVSRLTSTDLRDANNEVLQLLSDIVRLTGKNPPSINPEVMEDRSRRGTSGASRVTAGHWRITVKYLGTRAHYDLKLHPSGIVTGTGRWTVSRADLAGRWSFDPADQLLHLELSGGIQEGTKVVPVKITRWVTADTAECTFERRRAILERIIRG